MKILFTVVIFFLIPAILCMALLVAVVPLLVQRLLSPKTAQKSVVFPYQTSWEAEEAA